MGRLTTHSQHQMSLIFLPNWDCPVQVSLVFSFCIFGTTIVLVQEVGGKKIFVVETEWSGESCKVHLGVKIRGSSMGVFISFTELLYSYTFPVVNFHHQRTGSKQSTLKLVFHHSHSRGKTQEGDTCIYGSEALPVLRHRCVPVHQAREMRGGLVRVFAFPLSPAMPWFPNGCRRLVGSCCYGLS